MVLGTKQKLIIDKIHVLTEAKIHNPVRFKLKTLERIIKPQ